MANFGGVQRLGIEESIGNAGILCVGQKIMEEWGLRTLLLRTLLYFLSKPGGAPKIQMITGLVCLEASTVGENTVGL